MSKTPTVLVYHPLMLKHQTGSFHPEQPARLEAILKLLEKEDILSKLRVVEPVEASVDQIEEAHDPGYIRQVEEISLAGGGALDLDTALSKDSYKAARLAAGSVIKAVDEVSQGKAQNAFCLVRPPGHHATYSRGMGFCLFDNLAVGARYAQQSCGLSNILIVDWDAHHGNGIQDIFYSDPTVLYISLHQYPHYPGTGAIDETGKEKGQGFTLNFPFPPKTGEEAYLKAFDEVILPVASKFKPELVMVAAGYDSHTDDPLASLELTTKSFARLTEKVIEVSKLCSSRIVVSLEGGYNLEALPKSALATIATLASVALPRSFFGEQEVLKEGSSKESNEVIAKVLHLAKNYWLI